MGIHTLKVYSGEWKPYSLGSASFGVSMSDFHLNQTEVVLPA